jgi:hypothetical protein
VHRTANTALALAFRQAAMADYVIQQGRRLTRERQLHTCLAELDRATR